MAFKVMRRGCVTDDYLDDLAVVLQSIRCGTGWQRFLVFAELTKSKKKVSWIALFVYFQRKGMLSYVWRRKYDSSSSKCVSFNFWRDGN